MNGPNQESIELFLQEASENLQYLREYSGLLQEPQTKPEELEKLYIASHTLAGTSGSYGFPEFSEVAAKMAHIFHYAMNAVLTPDMHGPLTEFLSDAISVLEFDLLQISSSGMETSDDIAAFKQRYAFAFPAAPPADTDAEGAPERDWRGRAHSRTFSRRSRMPTACRRMAKFRMKSSNFSFPRPRSICRPSPSVCSRSKAIPTRTTSIACSARCTP